MCDHTQWVLQGSCMHAAQQAGLLHTLLHAPCRPLLTEPAPHCWAWQGLLTGSHVTALAQCSFSMLRTILELLPPGRRLTLRLAVTLTCSLPKLSSRLWDVLGLATGLRVVLSGLAGLSGTHSECLGSRMCCLQSSNQPPQAVAGGRNSLG